MRWTRSAPLAIAALCVVGAIGLAVGMGHASGVPAEPVLFFGRFHPLFVHLPIGFLVLIAFGETLTLLPRLRERLDPTFALLLPPLLAVAAGAFVLGLLLSRAGGYPAHLIRMHRAFALATVCGVAATFAAWFEHRRRGSGPSRAAYRAALGVTLGLTTVTGHFGGALTHGEGYQTRYAPRFVRRWLGETPPAASESAPPAAAGEEPLVYRDALAPVLRARCAECHGPDKVSGGLRIDDLAMLRKGGQDGPAVVPGRADKSLLVVRLSLPADNDEHMPPAGRPGLSAEQVELVGWWIDRGASEALRVRDALPPDGARRALSAAATATPAAGSPGSPTTAAPPGSAVPSTTSAAGAEEPSPAEPRSAEPPATAVVPGTAATTEGADGSAWQQIVQPWLAARCGRCHGADRQKGKLRVDSLAAVLAGGSHGAGVVPGQPERGTILTQLRLPLDAADHMPPRSEPQPRSQEIELLAWWVEQGASAAVRASSVPAALRAVAQAAPRPPSKKAGSEPSASSGQATGEPAPAAGSAPTAPTSSAPAVSPPAVAATGPGGERRPIELFRAGVEPIFRQHCGSCHTGASASAGVDVQRLGTLLEHGRVVPGDPAHSSLLARLTSPEQDPDHMPPVGNPQPTPGEIAVVRLWIAKGAREDVVISPADLSGEVQAALQAQESAVAEGPPGASAAGAPGAKAPNASDLERVRPTGAMACEACAMAGDAAPSAPGPLGAGLACLAAVCRRLARRRRAR